MRRVFACSTSPSSPRGEAAPFERLRLWKTRRSIMSFSRPPPHIPWKWVDFVVRTSFRFDRWEWDIFFGINVSSRNVLYLHIIRKSRDLIFVIFFLSYQGIKNDRNGGRTKINRVSLVLINSWKRSWVVCCSLLFTEEALIGDFVEAGRIDFFSFIVPSWRFSCQFVACVVSSVFWYCTERMVLVDSCKIYLYN